MYDRNLVLRFLAFYEKTYHKAQSGLKNFLNGFLEDFYKAPTEKKLSEWRSRFESAMRASRSVFGQNGFRLWTTDRKGNGQWTRNVNAAIFSVSRSPFAHTTFQANPCSMPFWRNIWICVATPSRVRFRVEVYRRYVPNQLCFRDLERSPGGPSSSRSKSSIRAEFFPCAVEEGGLFTKIKTCQLCGQQIDFFRTRHWIMTFITGEEGRRFLRTRVWHTDLQSKRPK